MYYILEDDSFPEPAPYRTRSSGWNADMDDSQFLEGNYVSTIFPRPFEFELWEYVAGDNGMAEFYYEAMPLMRDDLIAALWKCGVDNLQTYPAILRNDAGIERTDYKVVNVVGKLTAANMDKSDYIDMGGTGIVAVGFRELIIDGKKAEDALMFRLAESITSIVIHESVRYELVRCGFKYLRYLPCG